MDSNWQVTVESPHGLSDRAISEARATAQHTGDAEAVRALTTYTAKATSMGGNSIYAVGHTKEEAVANARHQIRAMTGYDDDDLKINIVGGGDDPKPRKPWWRLW